MRRNPSVPGPSRPATNHSGAVRGAHRVPPLRLGATRRHSSAGRFGDRTPVRVGDSEWACPFRITGLPKAIDTAAHGIDALQALELALIGAGSMLSHSPQFRAGQIEMHDRPVKNAAELFLPLPMHRVQAALENLRAYLERQREKERKTKRDWFDPEWRRALLSMMSEIKGDLATLAAHLPIAPRQSRRGQRAANVPARGRRRPKSRR